MMKYSAASAESVYGIDCIRGRMMSVVGKYRMLLLPQLEIASRVS